MGYCYTVHLLSQHYVFSILILIFGDREQLISWEVTCTRSETCFSSTKQTKHRQKALNKLKNSYLSPSSKTDPITWTSPFLKTHWSLFCVSSEDEFQKTQGIWEWSDKTALQRYRLFTACDSQLHYELSSKIRLSNLRPWFDN